MNIKIFVNFTDFYNFTVQHAWTVSSNTLVSNMVRTINKMNGDCSCKRAKYIPEIEKQYNILVPALNNIEKASIKQALGVKEVHFQNNGSTILTF